MKHPDYLVRNILQCSAEGMSSRQVANFLNVSKSSVNDIIRRKKEQYGPRILLLDLETSAALVYCFGRFDVNISQDHVVEEGGKVLVASYSWFGSGKVESIYMTKVEIASGNDKRCIEKLYELYSQADAIVAHNAKRFDHKMLQTRGIFHGLGKLPTVKVIDTLQIAKQHLRLPSNKLDSIAAYFGLGRKIDTGGISLWAEVQQGSAEAMKQMKEYCEQDVVLLGEIFEKFLMLGVTGYNAALYFADEVARCKVCGSDDLEDTLRSVYTATSEYSEIKCNSCGAVHRTKINTLSKSKRKSLLA